MTVTIKRNMDEIKEESEDLDIQLIDIINSWIDQYIIKSKYSSKIKDIVFDKINNE